MDQTNGRLVLDIGNSRTKLGIFVRGRLVGKTTVSNGDLPAVLQFAQGRSFDAIVVGSVVQEDTALLTGLQALAPVRMIAGTSPSHLRNGYGTPETLGADRWANAVGGSLFFPDRAVLIVSLGTCVVYDLVDAQGTYRGGLISPGLRMRARSMNAFTARLPLVEVPEVPPHVGLSTSACMAGGAHHGLRLELAGLISEWRQQHQGLAVVLTGGDALRYARALENGIFAHPSLTLVGLHALSFFDPPAAGASVAG